MPALRPGMAILGLLLLLAACGGPGPMPNEAGACLAQLDQLGVHYSVAPLPAAVSECAVDNPVRITAALSEWSQPGTVSCAFALRLALFTREDVDQAAMAQLGRHVRGIRHLGAYSCRRENNGHGRWSQHAAGRAIDIAGFELDDGSVILVERDWLTPGPRGRFLREVAQRACARFSLVLTPDSDREHFSHLHLDTGPWRQCGPREVNRRPSPTIPTTPVGAAISSGDSGRSR